MVTVVPGLEPRGLCDQPDSNVLTLIIKKKKKKPSKTQLILSIARAAQKKKKKQGILYQSVSEAEAPVSGVTTSTKS